MVPVNLLLQIVFEEFGFNSLLAAPAPFFSLQHVCRLPVQLPLQQQQIVNAYQPQQPQQPQQQQQPLSPEAAAAASAAKAAGAGVVIDAGFSACYAVPFYDGQLLTAAVRRLNLGGKALTNLLKETVSYRSLNMSDEGLLMERLKEQLCWVSQVGCGLGATENPAQQSLYEICAGLAVSSHHQLLLMLSMCYFTARCSRKVAAAVEGRRLMRITVSDGRC